MYTPNILGTHFKKRNCIVSRPITADQIKALECKHAVYCKARDDSEDDLLVVKEYIHSKDGEITPNIVLIKNYVKDFYVTKPGFRNHKQKKEWEDLDKLQKFTSTQAQLAKNAAKALGTQWMKGGIRAIGRSPYLYGTDITTPTLIKKKYANKYPNVFTRNKVAVIDIETDVVEGHKRPIYVSITCRDKVFMASTEEYIGTMVNPLEKLRKKANELLGKHFKKRGIVPEIMICKNAGDACNEAIQRAHQWKPDFLTIWNIDFDIPRITDVLIEYGYDPAMVYSDPVVPDRFKFFTYKQGRSQKVTANDKVTPIHPADRWHVAEAPASFIMIDSMCTYKKIRIAGGNEPSYSLDYQLQSHLGTRKLKFDVAKDYSGLAWHEFMQEHYKSEYGAYNIFDCIGVELFDEKTHDLGVTLSVLSGVSEYKIFHSQPKRLIDQLYFYCLEEKNRVVATHADNVVEDIDDYVLGVKNWIITLPSHLRTSDEGINIIEELPDVSSEIYCHVSDVDIVSSYPTLQYLLNMSKETTYRELCRTRGVSELDQRLSGVNLLGGPVNAYEVARKMFKAPTFDALLEAFEEECCTVN